MRNYIKLITLSKDTPNHCYVLQIDNTKLLFNLGAYNLDYSHLYDQKDTILECEAIFISHFDLNFSGALPFLKQINYTGMVYCTIPVCIFSQICIQEYNNDKFLINYKTNVIKCDDEMEETIKKQKIDNEANTKNNVKKYYKYEQEEIESIFSNVVQLKYSQPIEITNNIVIAAYRSGNSLGGSIWKISIGDENILVCLDVNQRKEMHLDGMDTDVLNNVTICLFNVSNKYETIKKIEKERMLCDYIKQYNKILIVVKFTRFLEVCCFLNDVCKNTNIKVLSNCGKDIITNAKSMVEWAGSNVTKDLNENKNTPYTFKNISFGTAITEDDKIIIVFDNYDLNYLYKQALDLISQSNTNLLLIDEEFNGNEKDVAIPRMVSMTDDEIQEIENVKNQENKKKNEEKAIEKYLADKEDDSDDTIFFDDKIIAKKMFWYEYKTDFYVEDEEDIKYAVFPVEKPVKFDEYGEIFYYNNTKEEEETKTETEKSSEITEETKYEKIEWEQKKIELKCQIKSLDFNGLCEFGSVKNILEIIKPEKLVFLGKKDTTDFYYKFFSMNSNFNDVYILENMLNLSYDVNITQLKVLSDFDTSNNMKRLKNSLFGSFKCVINDENELSIVGNGGSYVYGTLNIDETKNLLIEKGYKAEKTNNVLCIENSVNIIFKNNEILLEGEYSEMYVSVKSIIYQNLVFLNQ
ncbi:cleavage and polyadenylation specificity factor subunit 2 [Binucleata daphniae]